MNPVEYLQKAVSEMTLATCRRIERDAKLRARSLARSSSPATLYLGIAVVVVSLGWVVSRIIRSRHEASGLEFEHVSDASSSQFLTAESADDDSLLSTYSRRNRPKIVARAANN